MADHLKICGLALLSFCMATSPAVAATRQASVPSQFHGEWNIDIKDCGTSLNDSRLRIGPTRIRHYESVDNVLAVVVEGRREIAMIAKSSGEGDTRLATLQYKLSADGRRLTDIRNEQPVVRYRCGR